MFVILSTLVFFILPCADAMCKSMECTANSVPAQKPHNTSTVCCTANLPNFDVDVPDGLFCVNDHPVCSCNAGYHCEGPGCFEHNDVPACDGRECLINTLPRAAAWVTTGWWPFQSFTQCVEDGKSRAKGETLSYAGKALAHEVTNVWSRITVSEHGTGLTKGR